MSNVRRVYVEKKPAYAVQAKELKHEISTLTFDADLIPR